MTAGAGIGSRAELVRRFAMRAEEAGAHVHVVGVKVAMRAIEELIARLDAEPAVGSPDLDAAGLRPESVTVATVATDVSNAGAGVSLASAGLAETGSVVLMGSATARWVSLLAPVHVVVLRATHIERSLDDVAHLLNEARERRVPYTTLITGPTRTADIERVITIGAHGPRALEIVVLEDGDDASGADD